MSIQFTGIIIPTQKLFPRVSKLPGRSWLRIPVNKEKFNKQLEATMKSPYHKTSFNSWAEKNLNDLYYVNWEVDVDGNLLIAFKSKEDAMIFKLQF